MPSMASTSMYGVSPRSGLPKFRQLVIAAGVPPVQATFSADSQTASAPPRRGSSQTRRPLPSSDIEMARSEGVRRTTPASAPGRTIEPEPTYWSYWPYTHALEAMLGAASSVSSVAPGSSGAG